MIRRIALFMLCACAAAFAQTTTFTANLKDLGINTPTAYVELTLKNCAGSGTTPTIPHVNGVGVVTFPVQLYPVAGAISTTVYDETFIVCGSSAGVGYYHIAIYQGDSTRSLVKKLLFADDFDVQGASFNLNSATPRSGAVITPPPATAVLTNPAGNQTVVQPVGTSLSINHLSATFSQNANGADMIAGNRFTDTSPTGNFLILKNAANNTTLWDVDVTGTLTTGIVPAARVSSGTVAIANGGTGQTTAAAAFNALSPLTTLGDLIFGNGANSGTRLAGNTTTTKNFLTQTGTGTVSAAPAWGSIASADLTTALTTPPAIGASTPSTGAFTSLTVGAGTFTSVNSVQECDRFAGADAGAKITACIAALPAAGGTADARGFGATTQAISSQLNIGSATKQVTLKADPSTRFNVSVTGGVPAIQIFNASTLDCGNVAGSLGTTTSGGGFWLTSTANVSSLVTNGTQDGTQEFMRINGCLFAGNASATVTNSIGYFKQLFVNSKISDSLFIGLTPGIAATLKLEAVGDFDLDNDWVNAASGATCGANVIPGLVVNGSSGGVNIHGGAYEHSCNAPIVALDGSTGLNFPTQVQVNLHNLGIETQTGGTATGISCTRCNGVTVDGVIITGVAGTDFFKINGAAGTNGNITLRNITNTVGTYTNIVNDAVHTYTRGGASLQEWHFPEDQAGSNFARQEIEIGDIGIKWPSSGAFQFGKPTSAGTGMVPGFACSGLVNPTSCTIYNSQTANDNVSIGFAGDNKFRITSALRTVTMTGTGGDIWNWNLGAASGDLLAVTDGVPSIGANGANRPLNIFAKNAVNAGVFQTASNCTSTGGTCGAAAAGAVTIAAAATTVTVSTTAVTANSDITVTEVPAMGTRLGVTCNVTTGRTYTVTTITAGTSFVITASAAPATNPACLSYHIMN